MYDFPVIRKTHAQNNIYHENILQSVLNSLGATISLCVSYYLWLTK